MLPLFTIFLSQEKLTAKFSCIGLNFVVQNQLFATGKDYILSYFNTKRAQTTYENSALRLFGYSFDTHGTDVTAPTILDLIVVDINFL